MTQWLIQSVGRENWRENERDGGEASVFVAGNWKFKPV